MQLKESSILVEPDIPIYDLREVMQQVGFPVEPRTPLFDKLQVSALSERHPASCACVTHADAVCRKEVVLDLASPMLLHVFTTE